jgi:hypothetical protein
VLIFRLVVLQALSVEINTQSLKNLTQYGSGPFRESLCKILHMFLAVNVGSSNVKSILITGAMNGESFVVDCKPLMIAADLIGDDGYSKIVK